MESTVAVTVVLRELVLLNDCTVVSVESIRCTAS